MHIFHLIKRIKNKTTEGKKLLYLIFLEMNKANNNYNLNENVMLSSYFIFVIFHSKR